MCQFGINDNVQGHRKTIGSNSSCTWVSMPIVLLMDFKGLSDYCTVKLTAVNECCTAAVFSLRTNNTRAALTITSLRLQCIKVLPSSSNLSAVKHIETHVLTDEVELKRWGNAKKITVHASKSIQSCSRAKVQSLFRTADEHSQGCYDRRQVRFAASLRVSAR